MTSSDKLRSDAEAIWRVGVEAVDSERLVADVIETTEESLTICGHTFPLSDIDRIVVVGTGKAGAGMASGCEASFGERLLSEKVTGWVNVPADCVRELRKIDLHAARPAGHNEPTPEGVAGSERILELIADLGPRDLCIVLISGGGSALLPAPAEGISLEDKQAVTRLLMHGGATIDELNCVRKRLSRIKGGGLARSTSAGCVISLIISDVIGDPLDIIASGPTVEDPASPSDALAVLRKYAASDGAIPSNVIRFLERADETAKSRQDLTGRVFNHVIGNNATALEAASAKAAALGYEIVAHGSDNAGEACAVGRELARECATIRDEGRPVAPPACLLSGGEPIVHLATTDRPRNGGRNQEVALAALDELWDDGLERIVILSGGTDGEDGPTDAAGGIIDNGVLRRARELGASPRDSLAINDSYSFLQRVGGLLITGPTHTNVMDLRVALVAAE